jgi:hypothetical protein
MHDSITFLSHTFFLSRLNNALTHVSLQFMGGGYFLSENK